ncbi:MAG: cation:proton antiporter, partial [Terriglobus roseus]|nr:cation:proton antiporter [Terriglobus roseus]
KVSFHWFCYTILYECIFGAFYGVCIGYIARRAIRYAHEKDLIDRESFLVFYFVLALFCAGSGSLLGMDDLLIGFACGVGFSNDGWFLEKTEEAHVSNVIDLLINLAFFVYFGTIIPWDLYNSDIIGTSPWRLVVLGILVIFFRRIPIMLAMKPLIPDIKTWREALFAGHFGPIGVGAIFVAILARAELETEETTPLAKLPPPGFEHLNIIELIWPITTFLVIISIVVHGSSIAVFTLGKHINTLTLTLSYTQANEEGPSWMERLPRIQSRSRSSMSRRADEIDENLDEKGELAGVDAGMAPIGLPRNFLRRQRDEEEGRGSRSSSMKPFRRKKWDSNIGPGGPISQSAITPVSQNRDHTDPPDNAQTEAQTESETLAMNTSEESSDSKEREKGRIEQPEEEVYEEGDHTIIEDEDGNVLEVIDNKGETDAEKRRHIKQEGEKLMEEKHVEGGVSQTEEGGQAETAQMAAQNPRERWAKATKNIMQSYRGLMPKPDEEPPGPSRATDRKRGPALAYQYGNTIIVEDEDGEVLKKYDIPTQNRPQRPVVGDRRASLVDPARTKERIQRIGNMLGIPGTGTGQAAGIAEHDHAAAGPSAQQAAPESAEQRGKQPAGGDADDDDGLRFTISAGGRRMSKAEFIEQIQKLDPKSRAQFVERSSASEPVKEEARKDARDQRIAERKASRAPGSTSPVAEEANQTSDEEGGEYVGDMRGRGPNTRPGAKRPSIQRLDTADSNAGDKTLALVDSNEARVPMHAVSEDLARFSFRHDTAAQRRRRNMGGGTAAQGGGAGAAGATGTGGTSQNDAQYEGIERSQGGLASAP